MSDNQTLEAPNSAIEPSSPVEEAKPNTAEGEIQEPSQEAETPKPEEAPKAEPELSEVDKVKQAMQKRIDRQTAASKAAQEQLRQLQSEVEALRATAPKADDAPKQDDYKTYEEWEQATIDFKANQKVEERIKSEKEKELKVAQERQAAEVRRQFDEKEKAFRTIATDYDRVAGEAVQTMNELGQAGYNISGLRDVVMTFDNPPEMIYQLGKDTALIEKLVSMPPLAAMYELVKLEIAFKANKTQAKEAPPPIKTLKGTGKVAKALDEMSFEERNAHFATKG